MSPSLPPIESIWRFDPLSAEAREVVRKVALSSAVAEGGHVVYVEQAGEATRAAVFAVANGVLVEGWGQKPYGNAYRLYRVGDLGVVVAALGSEIVGDALRCARQCWVGWHLIGKLNLTLPPAPTPHHNRRTMADNVVQSAGANAVGCALGSALLAAASRAPSRASPSEQAPASKHAR